MITRDSLQWLFDHTRTAAKWSIDDVCLWGYFFTDHDRDKLAEAAPLLQLMGYRVVGFLEPTPDDDDQSLLFCMLRGSSCTPLWQSKSGGMEAAGIRRLRELEDKNRRLKTDGCGSVTGESRAERCDRKKALRPAAKRELVAVLRTEHGLSERQASRRLVLPRSVYQYEPRPIHDGPIIDLLLELGSATTRTGFWQAVQTPASAGSQMDHKSTKRTISVDSSRQTGVAFARSNRL